MSVTVYTKPSCVQCNATYRALDKAGIEYNSIDVTQDAAALEHILSMGFQQAPVVITEIGNWTGFHPDKILDLRDYLNEVEKKK